MQPSASAAGKTIRMNRIFDAADGRALMVAINHGIAIGPAKGIGDMPWLMRELSAERPDAFTIHKGIAMRTLDSFAGRSALILKSTNATRFFTPEETPIASVDEAIRIGADAVAIAISLADPLEKEAVTFAARMVEAAEAVGLPTVTHSYPCGKFLTDAERYSVESVGYATRVSLELGVDIIKTFWTGSTESFAKIVRYGAPARMVISGGPRCATLLECMEMTRQGMDAGAAGVTYGRNIWQHEHPAAVVRGLRAIIHGGATAKEGLAIASEAAGAILA